MDAAVLPLLAVVPLLAAGATVLVRNSTVDRVLLVAVPLCVSAAGVGLLFVHADEPALAHNVAGFVPGVAIPFVSDTLTAVMLVITGLTTAMCGWFLAATGEDRYRFVPPLVLMLMAGVNGALLTGDLFNLFVFVEVMLLPSYALIAVTGTWKRIGVGRVFVLVNLLTSTFLLVAVGFVYAVAGSVNLAVLADAGEDPRVALAIIAVLLALAIKGGLVPVHGWLPTAYPATSAGIMALFSALHTKVAVYAIFRVYSMVFGEVAPWLWVFVAVVVLTMIVGALSTAGTNRIRDALAFQMVSGVGHILLGVVLFTGASLAAGLFYLTHHVITMGGLLLLTGAIEQVYGTGRYDRLSGLMRRDPWVAVAFTLGLFSLIGLPPTSGLWGKVGLVIAAADAPAALATVLIAAVILASLASLMALQRLWEHVFWGPPMEKYAPDSPEFGRAPPAALPDDVHVPLRLAAPGGVLIVCSVLMFLLGGLFYPVTQTAAAAMMDIRPYVQAVLR